MSFSLLCRSFMVFEILKSHRFILELIKYQLNYKIMLNLKDKKKIFEVLIHHAIARWWVFSIAIV